MVEELEGTTVLQFVDAVARNRMDGRRPEGLDDTIHLSVGGAQRDRPPSIIEDDLRTISPRSPLDGFAFLAPEAGCPYCQRRLSAPVVARMVRGLQIHSSASWTS